MSTSAHIRHNSTAHRRKPSVFALSLGDPSLLLDDDENNNSSNSSISPLRFTTSSTSKSKSAAASTSADGSDSISPTLTAAEIKFASQQARKQRKLYAKLLSGCVVVAALLYLGQGFLARRQVDAACARRKDALLGRGEAFAVRLPQQHDGATLDVCSRVMLFKFDGNAGFASEMNLLIRSSLIASKLGYILLIDQADWQYGSWSDFFLPKQIYCRPPDDWFMASSATPLGAPRWRTSDRVRVSRELSTSVDEWVREETLDHEAMVVVREDLLQPHSALLPEGDTVNEVLEDSFADQAGIARELWRPNDQLDTMIRSERMRLGLGTGGVRNRKHSAIWGGRKRKAGDGSRAPVEAVHDAGEEHDFEESGGAERSDRGPLIAVQAELGGAAASEILLIAAGQTVRRLSKSSVARPGYSRSRPTLFPSTSTSTLLFLTREPLIIDTLSSLNHDYSNFTLSSPSLPTTDSLRQWLHLRSSIDLLQKKFVQFRFNQLEAGLRTNLARYYLRDLTIMSLYADAFVVSGSSQTGQLACLIAGEDAVVGPRGISGRGLGGRVRSVDTPWLPVHDIKNL